MDGVAPAITAFVDGGDHYANELCVATMGLPQGLLICIKYA